MQSQLAEVELAVETVDVRVLERIGVVGLEELDPAGVSDVVEVVTKTVGVGAVMLASVVVSAVVAA